MFVLPCLPSLILVSKAHMHFFFFIFTQSLPGVTVLYHITRMPEWGKHTFFHTFPAVSFQTRPQQTLLWSWKQPEPQLCEDKETGSTCSSTATAADLAAFQREREPRYNVRNIMTSSGHLNRIITYRERETEKEQSEMSCPLVETYLCQLSQLLCYTITGTRTSTHTSPK